MRQKTTRVGPIRSSSKTTTTEKSASFPSVCLFTYASQSRVLSSFHFWTLLHRSTRSASLARSLRGYFLRSVTARTLLGGSFGAPHCDTARGELAIWTLRHGDRRGKRRGAAEPECVSRDARPPRAARSLASRALDFSNIPEASHPNASRTSLAPSLTSPPPSTRSGPERRGGFARIGLGFERPRSSARGGRRRRLRDRAGGARARDGRPRRRARGARPGSRAPRRVVAPRGAPPRVLPRRRVPRRGRRGGSRGGGGGLGREPRRRVRERARPRRAPRIRLLRAIRARGRIPRRRRPPRAFSGGALPHPPGHPARGRVRGRREERRGRPDRRGRERDHLPPRRPLRPRAHGPSRGVRLPDPLLPVQGAQAMGRALVR